jgi:P-type Cu+ transporter
MLIDERTPARREGPPRERTRRAGAPSQRAVCFHCGEPCADHRFAKAEKVFCCQGCLVVHDLLNESGLGHFYDLSRSPGVRIQRASGPDRWTCLDAPEVQQRLLDFTDGRQGRVTFHIPAIHCIACVWLLENLFRLHPGVGHSQVNFPKREAAITFATEKIKLSELVALLASIGYEPALTLGELEKPQAGPARAIQRRRWLQVGVAGFAFGNIMLLSLPQYFGLDGDHGAALKPLFGWMSLALALPVVVFSAADYWKSAWFAARQRALTLDVPIALGLAAIYGQSVLEIVSRTGEGYCDSLTGLIFFLLCGRIFQQKTHERLVFDRDYKSFFPLTVTRRSSRSRMAGEARTSRPFDQSLLTSAATQPREERVSLSQLQVGERIILRNGELIPADAKLINGPAFIDYSFVTGESEPVAKSEGDYLYAGGQQIGATIEVETVKPVSQSYLTSLWDHEAFQKNREDDFDTLTNRYSQRFTLLVMSVALGGAVFWVASGDLPRGIKAFTSVLIVACPCALALAAPFTLGTAQRWLARINVFLKNALVLERLARVDAIVFDKTGTLTSAGTNAVRFVRAPESAPLSLTPALSRPPSLRYGATVASRVEAEGEDGRWERENRSQSRSKTETGDSKTVTEKSQGERRLFPLPAGEGQGEGELTENEARWIFSLTRHSTHPHSVRISESFGGKMFPEPVHSFMETTGCGIEGQVDGHEIWLGSRAWLESRGVKVGQASRLPNGDVLDQGRRDACPTLGSAVHIAIDGRDCGSFVLASSLRPNTDQVLRQLGERYELALLSGDNEHERERFRAWFSHDAKLHFNQSPLDKLGFIRRLQESGKTVMMVGDGLNDAGALKQSDVGVAVVEKVGAFSPASDVILDAARVPQLSEILTLARRAARIVRVSFGISAAYNAVGVSIAAAGLLSPLVCAVLMPVSSVSVVLFACGVTTWAVRRTGFINNTTVNS